MTLETDAPQGGTEAEAVADASQVDTAVEQNADDTAAQETGTDETGAADDAGEAAAKPKQVPWFQKRIDEVTAKKYEAEREAAYWRGIAEGRTPQQPPAQAQNEGPPREDQFESYEDYEQARIEYAVEQRLRAAEAQRQQQTVLQTYEERAAKLREAKPDFDSVVNNPSLRISETMANVIRYSEGGPMVAYHLGTNPTEAARIAAMPDYLQAAELGRIEASLTTQAPPVNRTPPPPPPKTVSGISAGLNKAPEEMSMAEYIAARKAGTI